MLTVIILNPRIMCTTHVHVYLRHELILTVHALSPQVHAYHNYALKACRPYLSPYLIVYACTYCTCGFAQATYTVLVLVPTFMRIH